MGRRSGEMLRRWTRRADGRRGGHPGDERLLELLLAPTSDGEAAARREHVAACDACGRRLRALEAVLAEARASLDADADAWFTEGRLDRQRAGIMRRLAGDRSPARILSFPGAWRLARPGPGIARRWVAAAAAAGLVLGLVAGLTLEPRRPGLERLVAGSRVGRPEGGPLAPDRSRLLPPVPVSPSDEAFLVELDAAMRAPRIEPLQVLDELTPRMAEVGTGGR